MPYIKDLMQKSMVAVSKNTRVTTALKLMSQSRVSVLPVIEGNKLAGVITKQDLGEGAEELKISDFRLRKLFVELKDKPDKAAKIMVENRVNRLPVVNSALEMKCVGIVSSTEIARSHKKKLF